LDWRGIEIFPAEMMQRRDNVTVSLPQQFKNHSRFPFEGLMNNIQISFLQQNGQKKWLLFHHLIGCIRIRFIKFKIVPKNICIPRTLMTHSKPYQQKKSGAGVLTDQETYPTCNAEASKGEPRRRIESTKKANKQMRGKSENIGVNPF
jgi:hypothetical protein